MHWPVIVRSSRNLHLCLLILSVSSRASRTSYGTSIISHHFIKENQHTPCTLYLKSCTQLLHFTPYWCSIALYGTWWLKDEGRMHAIDELLGSWMMRALLIVHHRNTAQLNYHTIAALHQCISTTSCHCMTAPLHHISTFSMRYGEG
jgi:hypothetical protein